MRTANYPNFQQQLNVSDDSPMFMEPFERSHFEQFYKSSGNQLMCWGEESNYMDSEFFAILEKADQGF